MDEVPGLIDLIDNELACVCGWQGNESDLSLVPTWVDGEGTYWRELCPSCHVAEMHDMQPIEGVAPSSDELLIRRIERYIELLKDAELHLYDDNGCADINDVDLLVLLLKDCRERLEGLG